MAEEHQIHEQKINTSDRAVIQSEQQFEVTVPERMIEVPMDEYRESIIESVRKNPNAVIIGETGSGKTTRVPGFLLDAFPGAKMAVTQPRRVAARSVSRYVAERRGDKIGGEIGYQVRFEDTTTEGTRCNFMTDGILLRKLQYDPLLQEYDLVMVDEAHERSLNIDFVLGLLRRAQVERQKQGLPELKVIAASATIEKEKFASYFGDSPIVEVPGRMFPVETIYEQSPVENYVEAAAQKVDLIARQGQPGDILIFMPGEMEIRSTIDLIEKMGIPGIETLPLFGSMAPEDQDKIFQPNTKRKVIVSTNIAETSLTIDGVRFVIDSGVIKQKEFNPSTGFSSLVERPHAKSGCEQRKGRAGRTAPGTVYRLYTEVEFNGLESFQKPEIARTNLDHVVLAMKKMGIDNIREFNFIDPPQEETIVQAIETLQILGALDQDEHLTPRGEVMAELPLRPELSRMVIAAQEYGCVESVCTIAAMFGERSVFVRPKGKEQEADQAHMAFKMGGSDFLAMLEVWKQWSRSGFNDAWARERYLHTRQLREIREVRGQLMRELGKHRIVARDTHDNPELVQKSVAAGLAQHLMEKVNRFGYQRVNGGENDWEDIFIHPSSATFTFGPRFIIGADVNKTSKTYARKCLPVKPEWIPDIAPQLVTEVSRTARFDESQGAVREHVVYRMNGRFEQIVRFEQPSAGSATRDAYITTLLNERVSFGFAEYNRAIVKTLEDLSVRSGGAVKVPDLRAWYEGKLDPSVSSKDLVNRDAELRIDINQYCSPEKQQSINEKYPKTITVRGVVFPITYTYLALYSGESSASDVYRATVQCPANLPVDIEETDFDCIGDQGRPELFFQFRPNEWAQPLQERSLAKMREQIDAIRFSEAWVRFNYYTSRIPVHIEPGVPLPTVESLGYEKKEYVRDSRGRQVFAYPGIQAITSSNGHDFLIQYFQSELEAQSVTADAQRTKSRDDADAKKQATEEALVQQTSTPVGFGALLQNALGQKIGAAVERQRNTGKLTQAPINREYKEKDNTTDSIEMTTELRDALTQILTEAQFFLKTVRSTPEPKVKGTTKADLISKARTRAADALSDLYTVAEELGTSTDALRSKGKVQEMVRRAEKIAADMARALGEPEQWPAEYRKNMARVCAIAVEIGMTADDAFRERVAPLVLIESRKGDLESRNREDVLYKIVEKVM